MSTIIAVLFGLIGIVAIIAIIAIGGVALSFIIALVKNDLAHYSFVQYKKGHVLTALVANITAVLHGLFNVTAKTSFGIPLIGLVIVAVVVFLCVVWDSFNFVILIVAIIIDVVLIMWIVKLIKSYK